MQLVAHFQAYFTVTAVLISQCVGNNIGHLLYMDLNFLQYSCFNMLLNYVKKQDWISSEG